MKSQSGKPRQCDKACPLPSRALGNSQSNSAFAGIVRGSIPCARQERNSLLKRFDRSQQAPKPLGPEPGYPPGNVPPAQPPDIPVPDPAPPPVENPGDIPLPPLTDPEVVTPGEPNPAQTPTRVLVWVAGKVGMNP